MVVRAIVTAGNSGFVQLLGVFKIGVQFYARIHNTCCMEPVIRTDTQYNEFNLPLILSIDSHLNRDTNLI